MSLSIEELEAKVKLLGEAFETIEQLDQARGVGPLAASAGARGAVGSMPSRMAATPGRAPPSPSAQPKGGGATVIAALTAANSIAGSPIESSEDLALLMGEAVRNLSPDRAADPRRTLVASIRVEYPDDRKLGTDAVTNTAKIEKVCGLNAPRYDRMGALVATGGICLPAGTAWDVPVFSTADRPVRDGLPAFEATRGALRFIQPPDIGVPSLQGTASGAGLSTTVWTEATDANPAGSTKPVWTIQCGQENLVYLNAVTTRVQSGNMQGRFFPEFLAAKTAQAIAVSARQAELELLTLMFNASKQVIPQQYLGAARDILTSVDHLRAQYLYSHRIPRSASFTCVFPDWARDVIRADLAREVAHDNAGSIDVLGVSAQQIDDYFSVRGINVIWSIDALAAGTYGTGGSAIPAQNFTLMGGSAPHPQWPGQSGSATFTLAWLLYVEGTYQFLDGGRLDLGVVRDSLLDASNDVETMVEVFESVAFRGLECYQVQSLIKPTGSSAGTVAATSYLE